MNGRLKLIVLTGPTAVGKTRLSIRLAQKFGSEIISADSRQLYREMTIGTAKPSPEELNLVRHYFIDHVSIHDYYSAGRYELDVHDLLSGYHKSHIMMVGGSGLYVRAVVDGIDDMPDPDLSLRQSLQDRYEKDGLKALLEELHRMDFDTWNSIDRKNPKRVIRALEVIHQTGIKYSVLKNQIKKSRDFDVLKIGLDQSRDELFSRINARVDEMIRIGLLDEVRSLMPWKDLTALKTVGYTEFFDFLEGKYDFQEALRLCKRNTRRYAKRQLTWFRKDQEIHWFQSTEESGVINLIDRFLSR